MNLTQNTYYCLFEQLYTYTINQTYQQSRKTRISSCPEHELNWPAFQTLRFITSFLAACEEHFYAGKIVPPVSAMSTGRAGWRSVSDCWRAGAALQRAAVGAALSPGRRPLPGRTEACG